MTKYKSKTNDRKKKIYIYVCKDMNVFKNHKNDRKKKKQYKKYETEKKNIKIIVFKKKIMLK
jgi:hypothetical protein